MFKCVEGGGHLVRVVILKRIGKGPDRPLLAARCTWAFAEDVSQVALGVIAEYAAPNRYSISWVYILLDFPVPMQLPFCLITRFKFEEILCIKASIHAHTRSDSPCCRILQALVFKVCPPEHKGRNKEITMVIAKQGIPMRDRSCSDELLQAVEGVVYKAVNSAGVNVGSPRVPDKL